MTFDLLVPVKVYHIDSTGHVSSSWRLYFDATLPYFGEQHRNYALLVIAIFLLFCGAPMLLLFLYSFRCFQKFLNLFPFRWYILHTFVDSLQGCYKDETEPGTRDCHWFAFFLLLTKCFMLIIGGATLGPMFFAFGAQLQVLLAVLIVSIQPFKSNMKHLFEVHIIFHLLLAGCYTIFLGAMEAEIESSAIITFIIYMCMVVASMLPLLYISAIALIWLNNHRRFGLQLVRKFHAWKSGYDTLG